MRIGQGLDVHAFAAGRKLMIGGVEIPHHKGLAGHSDADVLLHAICDALLGAAGLDDLGTSFPDHDERWRGADSAELCRAVVGRVRAAGFEPVNADVVIVTEGPRIAPHRAAMRERIGELLGLPAAAVNVKGKSLEGLGALAGGAGVAAQAVCLLRRAQ